jgi:hypothetical protein
MQTKGDSYYLYTEKKVTDFPIPSRDVTYQTLLSLAGINLIIPRQGEFGW